MFNFLKKRIPSFCLKWVWIFIVVIGLITYFLVAYARVNMCLWDFSCNVRKWVRNPETKVCRISHTRRPGTRSLVTGPQFVRISVSQQTPLSFSWCYENHCWLAVMLGVRCCRKEKMCQLLPCPQISNQSWLKSNTNFNSEVPRLFYNQTKGFSFL